MRFIFLVGIFVHIIVFEIFSQSSIVAEKGPYKNGTSVFRITTDSSNPTIIIATGWGRTTGFWGQVKSDCISKANNDIYSLINTENRVWILTIKDYDRFLGDPLGTPQADHILGLNIQSSCLPWYNFSEQGRNYFIVEENEPDPCESVAIEDLGLTVNHPENRNTIDAEYTFRVKGPLNKEYTLWFSVGVDNDLQPANYSREIQATDLEVISEEDCEGIHSYKFTITDIFGSIISENDILNLDYFKYELKDENDNFIFGPVPSGDPFYFYKDSCDRSNEEIKINSSKFHYLYNDIPISAYVTTSMADPQLKVSLIKNSVEVLSGCLSLGEGEPLKGCMNTSKEVYTLELVLNEVFSSSPSFDWLSVEEIRFTVCDSECKPSTTSKTYRYDGYNQIILHFKQFELQPFSLEEYLINRQLIPKPINYPDEEDIWEMDYDYFMEDPNIQFSSTPNWNRGHENYPYRLSDFPVSNSYFRFARYQNTMGFYNWSAQNGSSGVAIPGGQVHSKPWINSQHAGEFIYWVVDGQYSDHSLLNNLLGVPFLPIRVIVEPSPADTRAWISIYQENYDDLTQEEAEALQINGITSYDFAPIGKGWPQDGEYMVRDRVSGGSHGEVPGDWNWEFRDHTSGTGQMYIVNADISERGLFYKHTMNICPGTTARLSAWFLNLCNGTFSSGNNYYPESGATAYDNRLYPIKPNIQMKITAKVWENEMQKEMVLATGYTGEIQFTTEWELHFVEFEVPSNIVENSVTVEFLNMWTGGQGNDFAIDDIRIERLKCELELDNPSIACYNSPDFNIRIKEKSLYEFHKSRIYPDKIYFQWKIEKWNNGTYMPARILHLGRNAVDYAYDVQNRYPMIGVIDFDDYKQGMKILDYTFTAPGNDDVDPEDRNENDRYTLIIGGSPEDLSGTACSSSVSYILRKESFDIEIVTDPGNEAICIGEKIELQIVATDRNSLNDYDWYEWEIEGDYEWDIDELGPEHKLINPKWVGRSGPDGKIVVYPEKTCVYRIEGFCLEEQYVILNVAPQPKIYFTENDVQYIHPETGVFTIRICSRDSLFTLPCFDTEPAIGQDPGQIDGLYYEIYRVNEKKEKIGSCLKKGIIEDTNKSIGDFPSVLDQEDVNIGNHTETYVIILSLTEAPNEEHCKSRIYFNVRNISDKAVWDPQPGNKDNWNYDENWKVFSSKDVYDIHVLPYEAGVPMACTDVMIQGNSSWYPDLKSEEEYNAERSTDKSQIPSDYRFSSQPTCNTITFEMGGKLGNQHHLAYRKAFIEYNFGYYDKNNNLVNGKPSSQIMRRDRFYTITIPLRDMVIGDFSFGGKPNAYSRYAEVIRDRNTENMEADIEMTDPIPFYNVELKPGFGFAYKVLPFGETEINNQKNLNRTKGVVRIPNFENERDGMLVENYGQNHHNIWDKTSSTNTFYYYLMGYPDQRLVTRKDTKFRCRWEEDESLFSAFRFISEEIYVDESAAGTVVIKSPKETAHILVGNPFFSFIHFNSFYEANQDIIYDYYYIYDGENVLAYYPSRNISTQNGGDFYDDQINASGFIAPSQAFFVDPIIHGSEFNITLNAQMTTVNPEIKEKVQLRSGTDLDVLRITTSNADYSSTAVIICHPSFHTGTGVPKVFSDKTSIPEIYIKQDGIFKSIVEIGDKESVIPLGIKTSRRNADVTFSIDGLEAFTNRYTVWFYDSETKIKKELSPADCTYSFFNTKGNETDRFYLLLSSLETGHRVNELYPEEDMLISVYDNILQVISSQDNLMEDITIYNQLGQIVQSYKNINQSIFRASVSLETNVYILEVNTRKTKYVNKITIK